MLYIKIKILPIFLLLWFIPVFTAPAPPQLSAGLRLQKTHRFYLENGVQVSATHPMFLQNRIHIGLSFVSSRFGSALNTNALKQDRYTGFIKTSALPKKMFDPYLRLSFGYFRFDTEIPQMNFLDNTSPVLALGPGLFIRPPFKWGKLYFELAYNLFQSAHTLYPLEYSIGYMFNIFPWGGK